MISVRRSMLVGGDLQTLRGLQDRLATVPSPVAACLMTTVDDTISSIFAYQPDLILLQPERFPENGLEICGFIRKRFPAIKIVIITTRTEIGIVLAYGKLGVAAYLLADDVADLADYLGAVEAGQVVLSRSIAHDLAQLFDTSLGLAALSATQFPITDILDRKDMYCHKVSSPRRNMVLRLAGEGLTNKEIARVMGIRESTVAEHLKRHRQKHGPVRRAALGRTRVMDSTS